jgi:DNA-directed RNA polymerase subunit RPC12/RpoP
MKNDKPPVPPCPGRNAHEWDRLREEHYKIGGMKTYVKCPHCGMVKTRVSGMKIKRLNTQWVYL